MDRNVARNSAQRPGGHGGRVVLGLLGPRRPSGAGRPHRRVLRSTTVNHAHRLGIAEADPPDVRGQLRRGRPGHLRHDLHPTPGVPASIGEPTRPYGPNRRTPLLTCGRIRPLDSREVPVLVEDLEHGFGWSVPSRAGPSVCSRSHSSNPDSNLSSIVRLLRVCRHRALQVLPAGPASACVQSCRGPPRRSTVMYRSSRQLR
jgi:hypothetical protein